MRYDRKRIIRNINSLRSSNRLSGIRKLTKRRIRMNIIIIIYKINGPSRIITSQITLFYNRTL
jgi:hypothetical protein